MDGPRWVFHDSLQRSMQDMLGVRERVLHQEKKLFPGAVINAEALDLFDSASRVNHGDGPYASTSNALAWFSFCIVLFISCNDYQDFVP